MKELKHLSQTETQKKLSKFSPTMCFAKWSQFLVHLNNGLSASCCLSPAINLKKSEVGKENFFFNSEEVLQDRLDLLDGKKPKSCDVCWNAEACGEVSDRIHKSSAPWSYLRENEIAQQSISPEFIPSFLEISFSNICQFSCGYCYPNISSSIYREIKKFGAYPTSDSFNNLEQYNWDNYFYEDEENPYVDAFWDWLPSRLEKIQVLKLTGGEPLLSRSTTKFFQFLASKKLHDTFELHVNTNLGIKKEVFLKRISELKEIKLSTPENLTLITSLDGMGPLSEYFRYGLDLKVWRENFDTFLENFPLARIRITATLNLTSVYEVHALFEYVLELKKLQKYEDQLLITCYSIHNPKFLALRLMNEDERKALSKALAWVKSKETLDYKNGFKKIEVDFLSTAVAHSQKQLPMAKHLQLNADFYDYMGETLKRKPPRTPEQRIAVEELIESRREDWLSYTQDLLKPQVGVENLKELVRLYQKLSPIQFELAEKYLAQNIPKSDLARVDSDTKSLWDFTHVVLPQVKHLQTTTWQLIDICVDRQMFELVKKLTLASVPTAQLLKKIDELIDEKLKTPRLQTIETCYGIYIHLFEFLNKLPLTWQRLTEMSFRLNDSILFIKLFTEFPSFHNEIDQLEKLTSSNFSSHVQPGFQEIVLCSLVVHRTQLKERFEKRLVELMQQTIHPGMRINLLAHLRLIQNADISVLPLNQAQLPDEERFVLFILKEKDSAKRIEKLRKLPDKYYLVFFPEIRAAIYT